MSKVNPHMHSNASDGRLSPEDIVAKAANQLMALAERCELRLASL